MEQIIDIASKPVNTVIPAEVLSTQINDEGPRVCPLCSSRIRFFFINFNEKMLMCEKIECEYPFGYEDLQFLRLENDEDMSDVISLRTRRSPASPLPTGSVVSTAAWSEIDKMNQIYDSEDTQSEPRTLDVPAQNNKKKTKKNIKESERQMKKNVEDIKELSMELIEISETSNKIIKNEKWIKNLMSLQEKSGVKLLKPVELNQVNKGKKELKINIDNNSSSNMSSIKIQIADNSGSCH